MFVFEALATDHASHYFKGESGEKFHTLTALK